MTRKLTLSISEKTILKARRISRKRGKSISRIVEEYLNSIVEKENKTESAMDQINRIMEPYRKKIKLPENVDYKEMVRQWRYEDYMKESEKRMKSPGKKGK
ncbi:MAG TPA: DUF6364 family protein [Chitinophagaceae bacterium]|nr:DUF6364 family protein [Chitinophagaceae bacterium]